MEGKRCLECIENKKEGTKMKEGKREEEGNKQANLPREVHLACPPFPLPDIRGLCFNIHLDKKP